MYSDFERILSEEGLKVADVRKGTGIGYSTFSDWKSGKSKPKYGKMKQIADFLGVSVDYLLNGEEPKRDGEIFMTSFTEEELSEAMMKAFKNQYYADAATAELAQSMKDNHELRVLFDAAKDATPEDLRTVSDMLMLLKQRRENAD